MTEKQYEKAINKNIMALREYEMTSGEEKRKDQNYALLICVLAMGPFVFFAPLAYYKMFIPAVVITLFLWTSLGFVIHIKRKTIFENFYRVENAEDKVEVIKVEDFSLMDDLHNSSAITFFEEPHPMLLRFIYNWLNNCGVLKEGKLKVYTLTGRDMRDRFGCNMDTWESLISISLDDLNITEKNKARLAKEHLIVGARWFDDIVSEERILE